MVVVLGQTSVVGSKLILLVACLNLALEYLGWMENGSSPSTQMGDTTILMFNPSRGFLPGTWLASCSKTCLPSYSPSCIFWLLIPCRSIIKPLGIPSPIHAPSFPCDGSVLPQLPLVCLCSFFHTQIRHHLLHKAFLM